MSNEWKEQSESYDELFKKWNQKWKSFIKEQVEGDNCLKTFVQFGDEGIEFLSNLEFVVAIWHDDKNTIFEVDFVVHEQNYTVHGVYPEIRTITPEPSMDLFEKEHLFELFVEFELDKMISSLDTFASEEFE